MKSCERPSPYAGGRLNIVEKQRKNVRKYS
jgi:hypothetical protein